MRWFIVFTRFIYILFAYMLKIIMYYLGKIVTNLILIIFVSDKNIDELKASSIIKTLFLLCLTGTFTIFFTVVYAQLIALEVADITPIQQLLNWKGSRFPVLNTLYFKIVRIFSLTVGLFLIEISYSFQTPYITSYLILYWLFFLIFAWYIITTTAPTPLYKNILQLIFVIIFLFNSYFFYQYYWCIIAIFDAYDSSIAQLKTGISRTFQPTEIDELYIILQEPQICVLLSTISSITILSSVYLYLDIFAKRIYSILINS